jgi:hypothetical protein
MSYQRKPNRVFAIALHVLLQCIGNIIWIPLCAKGCISETNMVFTDYSLSGQRSRSIQF